MIQGGADQYIGTAVAPPGTRSTASAKEGKRSRSGKPNTRFRLMSRFWEHLKTPELSHVAQAVWCYLWMLSDAARRCYPSNSRIGRKVGCSDRHARRAIGELVAAGFVKVVTAGSNKGTNRANVYEITLPAGGAQ